MTSKCKLTILQLKPVLQHTNLEFSSDHIYHLIVQLQIFICIMISETGMVSISL